MAVYSLSWMPRGERGGRGGRGEGEPTAGSTAGGWGFAVEWIGAQPVQAWIAQTHTHTHSAGIRLRNLVCESDPAPASSTPMWWLENNDCWPVTHVLLCPAAPPWRALRAEGTLNVSTSGCDPTPADNRGVSLECVLPVGDFMSGSKFRFLAIWKMMDPKKTTTQKQKHTYVQYLQSDHIFLWYKHSWRWWGGAKTWTVQLKVKTVTIIVPLYLVLVCISQKMVSLTFMVPKSDYFILEIKTYKH